MEHKTKYKQLTEAYLHALGVITESTATWAEFLCSAAYTYEERFQSQVLLHHQRPGVKAVATLNQWDREKNRHIVRGTHGIPVFDAKHPECLTYVFDYQDTAGRSTPGLLPWTVYESKSGIARHNLLRRSGEKSLDSYVHTKVQQIVDTEVKSETSAAMRTELQKFLEQSAKYVVYTRLNMPVDNLDTSAFSFATQYQNRPKVLERLGTLLSHSLVACLSPVRDIAQAMHMTMPPPEGLAVQKKDTRTRSVPETSEVTAEASPEAPREWGFYVIPDLKTWATNSSERTPIEHYETFEEARDRFAALRDQPYNKTNDLNDDGQPYAHLTLGLESKDKLSSVDILQVRAGQNYLVEDFTRMQRLRADSVVLENLSRVAREIGFDRVRPYVMENGSYKALPDMPFSQWENPYFTVDSPEQGDTFTIYQLKGGSETRDYRFEPYESLQEAGLAIDRQNYDLVYTAPLDGKTTLEDIFRTFNLDRPPDFTGHSLSVSDIVVLNRGGDTKAFPSFSHMAAALRMAIGTVQTAVKSLVAAGRLLKAAFRAGKHNLYILVETVAQALPGANPGAQKENRRAGTRRQKIEMLLASIASLISNSKILHEIGACQEVLLVFLKRVCQNLRNSNKTNPTYSTKERYFSLSRLAIKGEVRLSELPEPAAEVGVHGKVPFIQAEGFRVCSAFRAHGLPDRCARLFFSLYCLYSRCHQRR